MILIAAIRDYFYKADDAETARLIEEENLISKDRETHVEAAHFRLNAEDHQFFQNRIRCGLIIKNVRWQRLSENPINESKRQRKSPVDLSILR